MASKSRTAMPIWLIAGPRREGFCIVAPVRACRALMYNQGQRYRRPEQRGEVYMSNALAVTDSNFETEVEQASGLTIVDFWATWCGPCRMIAPILDQIAVEHAGKVKITKLDVDANIKTASRFNVRSIPMLLFFKDGKVVDTIVGAVPKMHIEQKLQQHAA